LGRQQVQTQHPMPIFHPMKQDPSLVKQAHSTQMQAKWDSEHFEGAQLTGQP
jgi:uncharacterized lipoprotein YbaY